MPQIDFEFRGYTVDDSHGFHGEHETPLTRGRDSTDYNGFHGLGPLRDPHAWHAPLHILGLPIDWHPFVATRLTQKKLTQIPQIPQIFADLFWIVQIFMGLRRQNVFRDAKMGEVEDLGVV